MPLLKGLCTFKELTIKGHILQRGCLHLYVPGEDLGGGGRAIVLFNKFLRIRDYFIRVVVF